MRHGEARGSRAVWAGWSIAVVATAAAAGCGKGALGTGSAAAAVGRDVVAQVGTVPRDAEVCAMRRSLGAPATTGPKTLREACADAATTEELWRRSMIVLGAYADWLEAGAAGADLTAAGPLAAARTGVSSPTWIEVDEPDEIDARTAVSRLVDLLADTDAKRDLDDAVQEAAPHVATLCEGLGHHFDEQITAVVELQRDVDKRQAARSDHRCGMIDNRSFCVGESAQDRLTQGVVQGEVAALLAGYVEAKNAVARFCAANTKLAEAAANGHVKSRDTATAVVEAVRSAPRVTVQEALPASSAAPPAGKGK
jgi:hypothetical protein